MTISNIEKIKCPQEHIFEASLLSAISVAGNPELKEALIAGEINLVSCPVCGEMFFAECFILYHDTENELIAFVYPLSFQEQATQCKAKMKKEFELALANFEARRKINYEPILLFGIEDLVLLLRSEQNIEDEEAILKYIAPKLSLKTVKISPYLSRKLGIPKLLPVPKGLKEMDIISLTESLQVLVKYNPNLLYYTELLEKILKHRINILDIKQ
ncbi:MAG: CpXC domain-containing protein [Endomicrobium sp.]|jgi:hypothetical protein|nr:CpXC domain-containing protein [Endomicrobium sp.]